VFDRPNGCTCNRERRYKNYIDNVLRLPGKTPIPAYNQKRIDTNDFRINQQRFVRGAHGSLQKHIHSRRALKNGEPTSAQRVRGTMDFKGTEIVIFICVK